MEIIAQTKHLRISARKVRYVVDAIRHLPLNKAFEVLPQIPQRAAEPVLKVLKQAVGNALNQNLKKEDLYLKEIQVNEAPTIKRWRAVSRGQGHAIMKRTSHIIVVLASRTPAPVLSSAPAAAKTIPSAVTKKVKKAVSPVKAKS